MGKLWSTRFQEENSVCRVMLTHMFRCTFICISTFHGLFKAIVSVFQLHLYSILQWIIIRYNVIRYETFEMRFISVNEIMHVQGLTVISSVFDDNIPLHVIAKHTYLLMILLHNVNKFQARTCKTKHRVYLPILCAITDFLKSINPILNLTYCMAK